MEIIFTIIIGYIDLFITVMTFIFYSIAIISIIYFMYTIFCGDNL